MSVFGKSQRYLAVLQKVSDIEMRLEAVKTEVDRQSLAHQAAEVPSSDDDLAHEIEKRFEAVLRDNVPTLVSEVRRSMESDWDLEAVIGKEVFRLLENHLPELTAKELGEEDIGAVTEEVSARVRRDMDGVVESKLNQLIPLVERENASASFDEFRPRVDHLTESLRRLWEEVTRLKTANRKLTKRLEILSEKTQSQPTGGGPAMIPEQLAGRASIENLVTERVQRLVDESTSSRDKRISVMEDRLKTITRAFESNQKLLQPGSKAKPVRTPRRRRPKQTTEEEKDAALDRILSTKLVVRDR